jgi:hypothetical protein
MSWDSDLGRLGLGSREISKKESKVKRWFFYNL